MGQISKLPDLALLVTICGKSIYTDNRISLYTKWHSSNAQIRNLEIGSSDFFVEFQKKMTLNGTFFLKRLWDDRPSELNR